MHGIDEPDELAYWRERARQAERERDAWKERATAETATLASVVDQRDRAERERDEANEQLAIATDRDASSRLSRTLAVIRRVESERDSLLDQLEAVERERDHMRDAIIALAGDVYDGARDHRIVIRAYREAANHLAEPFSIEKVERLVREAKERT